MKNTTLKLFTGYLLVLLFLIIGGSANGQTLKVGDGLKVVHFNAGWNSANDVKWNEDLENCKTKQCDIATDTEAQVKYEIVVVPTIIVFKDGEEVKRFQADISFAMKATQKDVQDVVDESNMDSW